jgi:nicotinic acid mononucleotide adenylyltransferase
MTATRADGSGVRDVLERHGWPAPRLAGVRGELPPWELDTALRMALALAGQDAGADLTAWREAMYGEARRRLFPQRFPEPEERVAAAAGYFFPLAQAVIGEQVARGGDGIAERLPFEPLAETEIAAWPSGDEYRRLQRAIEHDGLLVCYAMAQQWLGFSIADHILGVTGIALWMGRQLAGHVAVDLPLLHGAAIGHDVGKFGCIGEEERRIPRLHYYYTHVWYQARGLPGLGHIATNHSTWDLEQVRLPIETMLLIYADFRVKDSARVYGVKRMSVISLAEAYAEIRDKLENLDAAKLRRYRAVYRKLRDFEDFALALGAALDPPGFATRQPVRPRLPHGLAIVDVLAGRSRPDAVGVAAGAQVATTARLFTTAHNLGVMERLRDVPALRALLEEARSFEGWRDLRTYLGVLGEYSPALSAEQKELAFEFFFELLAHRDDDIRYQAANRIGDLLALGEDSWRKDLPEGIVPPEPSRVLGQLDTVLALLDRAGAEAEEDMGPVERVLYGVPIVVRRMLRRADAGLRGAALDLVFERLRRRIGDPRPLVGLYACETCETALPHARAVDGPAIAELAIAWADHDTVNTRLMAWRVLLALLHWPAAGAAVLAAVREAAARLIGVRAGGTLVSERFLLHRMAAACGLDAHAAGGSALLRAAEPVQDVMLRNLKSRVGWVEKKVNCDFLVAAVHERRGDGAEPGSYFANEVANHLANLLKVSRVEGTRFHAGRCLLRLLPGLTVTQRNDLFVELVRSLQLDVEAVTRYIPRFLGPVIAGLPEQEFNEALADIEVDVRRGNEPLQRLLLQTTVWVLLSLAAERLDEGVLGRLSGMLLGALAERRASTAHEGFAAIAMVLSRLLRDPAGDPRLAPLLTLICKKLLTLVTHRAGDRGRFFLAASALNHMDRALALVRRRVRFSARPTVAFIPGTFDPFTIAHAEVVGRVLAHADEAMVQVDDYSWNKHAQPREVRKELAWMALASVPGAFIAPFEPPVNLRNPASVRVLRRRLGGRPVVFAVGSDVLAGASAYRDPASHVWEVPHVVVVREDVTARDWEAKLGWFRARAQVVRLPARARDVSSSALRNALDRGGELEHLCDPLIARVLQERQLYVNYPSKKEAVRPPRFTLAVQRGAAPPAAGMTPLLGMGAAPTAARWAGRPREACTLTAREGGRALMSLTWREVSAAAMPVMLGDIQLATPSSGRLAGLGALVDGVAAAAGEDRLANHEALLALAMARWLDAGLQFVIVGAPTAGAAAFLEAFRQCGGSWLTDGPSQELGGVRWAWADLAEPLVLVWDLEAVLQPPYAAEPAVQEVVAAGRGALARFFCERSPGSALFHLNERETKRGVVEWARRRLADDADRHWVVLGLGRQFHRDVIGDCPTIAIDLERFLTSQGYDAGVHPSAGSPSLELQLHTAAELGRDGLLLVPFLDGVDAVQMVRHAARAAGIVIRDVLIGVTSASVHATLHLQNVPHRCGVVIPRWRGVIRESALAPYIGGWSIHGRDPLAGGALLTSLNDCLPYHHPHPLGLDGAASLDFSRLALDQTRRLFVTLEELFREREGRLLSLHEMGFVVRTPRCPPFPQGFLPPRERVPSGLLADDIEALARLHPESHEAHRRRWSAL